MGCRGAECADICDANLVLCIERLFQVVCCSASTRADLVLLFWEKHVGLMGTAPSCGSSCGIRQRTLQLVRSTLLLGRHTRSSVYTYWLCYVRYRGRSVRELRLVLKLGFDTTKPEVEEV